MISLTTKVLAALVVLACTVGAFLISFDFFETRAEIDMSQARTGEFPIVVVDAASTDLELYDLARPIVMRKGQSFLVPPDRESTVEAELQTSQNARHAKGIPNITIENVDAETQLIEIDISTEGLFTSRYLAKKNEIRPLSLKVTRPLFIHKPLEVSIVVGLVCLALVFFIAKLKSPV